MPEVGCPDCAAAVVRMLVDAELVAELAPELEVAHGCNVTIRP